MFVWKLQPLVYLKSQTRPANRFYSYQYFDQIGLAPPSDFQSYLASVWRKDLDSDPPEYVLIRDSLAPDTSKALLVLGIEGILAEDYVELPDVADYQVYKRKSADS